MDMKTNMNMTSNINNNMNTNMNMNMTSNIDNRDSNGNNVNWNTRNANLLNSNMSNISHISHISGVSGVSNLSSMSMNMSGVNKHVINGQAPVEEEINNHQQIYGNTYQNKTNVDEALISRGNDLVRKGNDLNFKETIVNVNNMENNLNFNNYNNNNYNNSNNNNNINNNNNNSIINNNNNNEETELSKKTKGNLKSITHFAKYLFFIAKKIAYLNTNEQKKILTNEEMQKALVKHLIYKLNKILSSLVNVNIMQYTENENLKAEVEYLCLKNSNLSLNKIRSMLKKLDDSNINYKYMLHVLLKLKAYEDEHRMELGGGKSGEDASFYGNQVTQNVEGGTNKNPTNHIQNTQMGIKKETNDMYPNQGMYPNQDMYPNQENQNNQNNHSIVSNNLTNNFSVNVNDSSALGNQTKQMMNGGNNVNGTMGSNENFRNISRVDGTMFSPRNQNYNDSNVTMSNECNRTYISEKSRLDMQNENKRNDILVSRENEKREIVEINTIIENQIIIQQDNLVNKSLFSSVILNERFHNFDIDENCLIKDLIYPLQGLNGQYIKFNKSEDIFYVYNKRISIGLSHLINIVSSVGVLFRKIKNFLDLSDTEIKNKSIYIYGKEYEANDLSDYKIKNRPKKNKTKKKNKNTFMCKWENLIQLKKK